MNWKRWKMGLFVACLTGIFSGLATLGIVDKVTWKELLLLLLVNISKDALLFLKDHPVDTVLDNSAKLGAALMLCFTFVGCAQLHVDMTDTLPNGVIRQTHANGSTLFNAKSELAKLSVQNGPRTNDHYLSIGSLNQSATNPITPEMLQALGQMYLQTLVPVPMSGK